MLSLKAHEFSRNTHDTPPPFCAVLMSAGVSSMVESPSEMPAGELRREPGSCDLGNQIWLFHRTKRIDLLLRALDLQDLLRVPSHQRVGRWFIQVFKSVSSPSRSLRQTLPDLARPFYLDLSRGRFPLIQFRWRGYLGGSVHFFEVLSGSVPEREFWLGSERFLAPKRWLSRLFAS